MERREFLKLSAGAIAAVSVIAPVSAFAESLLSGEIPQVECDRLIAEMRRAKYLTTIDIEAIPVAVARFEASFEAMEAGGFSRAVIDHVCRTYKGPADGFGWMFVAAEHRRVILVEGLPWETQPNAIMQDLRWAPATDGKSYRYNPATKLPI